MATGSNQGSALLSALFIMTLVAIAATAMTMRLQIDIQRTGLLIQSDKNYLASQFGVFWAMDALKNTTTPLLSLDDKGTVSTMPKKYRKVYPNITLSAHVIDLQSRLNINTANQQTFSYALPRLLSLISPSLSPQERAKILTATKHWISPFQPESDKEGFANLYQTRKPPYQPSHQPLISPTELRLVQGVTQSVYQNILPHIATLPPHTKINILTAPKLILQTLCCGMTKSKAAQWIQIRRDLKKTNQHQLNALLKSFNIRQDQITTKSEYFLCVSKVKNHKATLINYALLERIKKKKNKYQVRLISETLNSL